MKLKDVWRKPRFAFVYLLVIWLFVTARTTEATLRAGVIPILLGELLRLWANGYVGHRKVNWTEKWRGDAKIGRLITAGPYAFVRHPLYLGTFLIGVGFCVIVRNLWVGVAALGFFLLLYRRKMDEEETMIRGEVGAEFERYERAVPRWIPTGRRYTEPYGEWSWRGIMASKEWKTCVWVTVVVILLYFREEYVQEPNRWMRAGGGHTMALFGVMVALIAVDLVVELFIRRSKRRSGVGVRA